MIVDFLVPAYVLQSLPLIIDIFSDFYFYLVYSTLISLFFYFIQLIFILLYILRLLHTFSCVFQVF